MENKTLSVIIPNYNKSVYIRDTIESILAQTYRPKEIIIVDDASTDESKTIIKEYEKKYPLLIRAFYFEKNQGVQKARSFGVEKSSGEYITFVDSDDFYYDSSKLESEMKFVDPRRIVYSAYCFFDNTLKKYALPKINRISFSFFKHNQIYCYVNRKYMSAWPFAFIVSKDIFVKVGGYNFPFDYYEDLDLLIKYSIFGLQPFQLYKYGLAIRIKSFDVTHLSNQHDKISNVNTILKDRYKKKIKVFSRVNDCVFSSLTRIKHILLRLVRKRSNET